MDDHHARGGFDLGVRAVVQSGTCAARGLDVRSGPRVHGRTLGDLVPNNYVKRPVIALYDPRLVDIYGETHE